MIFTYAYPRPMLTVDCIVIALNPTPKILLIKRANTPHKNKWAIPGGFVEINEELENAAIRELREETGLRACSLNQFKTYGTLNRDSRGRTISVVYYCFIEKEQHVAGNSDAKQAAWFELNAMPIMAFDHNNIVNDFIAETPLPLHLKG